jgi:hypothetical protein
MVPLSLTISKRFAAASLNTLLTLRVTWPLRLDICTPSSPAPSPLPATVVACIARVVTD